MEIPQVVYIALVAIGGGVMISKHGTPHLSNHSFPLWLLAAGIQTGIIYWGGFFN